MNRHFFVVAAFAATLAHASPAASEPKKIAKPLSPIAPRQATECEALARQWASVWQQIEKVHSDCIFRYGGSLANWIGKGNDMCVKQCVSSHQTLSQASSERKAAVDACYAQVQDFRNREAQAQREEDAQRQAQVQAQAAADRQRQASLAPPPSAAPQPQSSLPANFQDDQNGMVSRNRSGQDAAREAELRRIQEIETARRERAMAEVNRARQQADMARQRAEAYRSQTGGPAPRPTLDRSQTAQIDGMRQYAEQSAGAAMWDRAADAANAVDVDGWKEAAMDIAREDALPVLMEGIRDGLAESDGWSTVMEGLDLGEEIGGLLEDVTGAVAYGRQRLNGETTGEQDANAAVDFTQWLAEKAHPNGGMISNVIQGTRNGLNRGFEQVNTLIKNFDRGLSADEIGRMSDPREVLREILSPFVPFDKIERFKRLTQESNGVIDTGRNAFFLFFGNSDRE
jgi:hypothetical protein